MRQLGANFSLTIFLIPNSTGLTVLCMITVYKFIIYLSLYIFFLLVFLLSISVKYSTFGFP